MKQGSSFVRSLKHLSLVQKTALIIGGSFLLFLMLSSYSGIKSSTKSFNTDSHLESEQPSELVLQDFSRIMLRKGKRSLEVKAKSGRYLPTERVTYLSEAIVKVQRENGEPVIIRAKNARLFMDGEQVKQADLEGAVEVEFSKGVLLKTELANFDSELQLIRAPGAAVIEGNGFRMAGDGMEAEVEKEVVKLLREVKSRFERGAELPKIDGKV
jgi:LPS export ABC transporter protein LptC